jgi:hypothetical protein
LNDWGQMIQMLMTQNLTIPTASYDLRMGIKVKRSLTKTRYETLTFGYFFPRLLMAFRHLDFSVRKDSFQTLLNANIKTDLKIFLEIFLKFDITRELIPVRNPAGSARNPAGIRPDFWRKIIGKMKKYFILLKKDLFKQKCDYNLYC